MSSRAYVSDRAPYVPDAGMPPPLSDPHSNHLCLIGDDPAATYSDAVNFLVRGLDHGERAVFVCDGARRDEVDRAFAAAGIDVAAEVERGALRLLAPTDGTARDEGAADSLVERCRADALGAAAAGLAGVRVALDVGCARSGPAPIERLIDWEARVGAISLEVPQTSVLCLYDRARFPAVELERVLGRHPAVVLGGRVCPNPYFEPDPADVPAGAAARLTWKLDGVRRLREVEEDRGRLMQRAHRLEVERRMSRRAEAALERMRQLQDITAAIAGALTEQEVIAALAERTLEALGARAIAVVGASTDSAAPELLHTLGWPWEQALEYRRLSFPDASLVCEAMRSREPAFVPTVAEYGARYPHLERIRRLLGSGSTLVIPLIGKDRVLGAVQLAFGDVREFTDEDHGFAATLGHLAGQAIERARMYGAVRASEDRFRVAQELSLDGFSILRSVRNDVGEVEDFIWEYANPAIGRMLRRDPSELVGRRMLEVFSGHPDWELHDQLVHVVETGAPLQVERFYDADDLRGWFRSTAVRLGDGIAMSLSDITERKRAEEQTRIHAVRSRVLAEAARAFAEARLEGAAILDRLAESLALHVRDLCVILLASADGHRLDVAAVRHGDAEVTRVLRDRATGPMSVERGLAAWAVRSDRTLVIDAPGRDRLESILPAPLVAYVDRYGASSLLVKPLLVCGKPVGALLLLRAGGSATYGNADRQLADEIAACASFAIDNARLYHEAQEAIRTRDEVLRIVAHDLRSPLNTISMSVRLLRDRIAQGTDGEKYLHVIGRSTTHMARLIDDLLDVARIEAGELAVEIEKLAAAPLVAEAVDMHRDLAAERGLELRVEIAEDLPPIAADRERIIQVFANLLGNAIKFTPAGGGIRVSVERLPDALVFSVSDTGPGITPDQIGLIFDRFWQASRARRAGAGLGLAIAKGIVEAHKGRIWAESEPGRGSTFSFTVPVA
ncbi:MAG TPA: ATP-binding protein [Longimicrobiales bacterium]